MNAICYEDWLCKAFCDLGFGYSLVKSKLAQGPFQEYKVFYCAQSIEKLLKSVLIKNKIINSEEDARKWSHNLVKMINQVGIIENKSTNFFKNLSQAVGLFYDIDFTNQKCFLEFETYISTKVSNHMISRQLAFYLFSLESSFTDVRYPYYQDLEPDSNGLIYGKEGVYLDNEILISTIEIFKELLKFHDILMAKENLSQYRWEIQEPYYDDPNGNLIEIYEYLGELQDYLFDVNNHLILG